jgi:hypothetical protein
LVVFEDFCVHGVLHCVVSTKISLISAAAYCIPTHPCAYKIYSDY